MKGLLSDINIQGQLQVLLRVWQSDEWRDLWESLGLAVHSFAELGLDRTAADHVIWHECQRRQIIPITANRNADGPDSLEETIRNSSTATSLPVFTLADARRVQEEGTYAVRVAVRLLEYFMDIDTVRGSGRLFVP